MGRPAAAVRLQAAPALKHLYGKAIQVYEGLVHLDAEGIAVVADKKSVRSLLTHEHWSLAGEK